ncbi:MAG: hypothetical protein COB40_05175 [Marinosulfonomonas sp.]|nr:MAG: hypothetical protein COB40_05175 [Marinosulfonomonas sp.]
MNTPVNPNIKATSAPPVMEAGRWIDNVTFPADRPLLNVSQAAPLEPPPAPLRAAIADTVLNNTSAHLYGPVLGLPELRAEVSQQWTTAYDGEICADQVAITSGCNQAFTSVMTTIAAPGDEVILPTPWYFNHKMHLDMQGVNTIPLPTDLHLLPDPDVAASLITSKTRAIVLVTPNNPAGVEYPPELVRAFYDLAKSNNIALILDETYRDFDSRTGAPHDLFSDPDWHQTLIQLYSFSKAYRLTGHRVGALTAAASRLFEVEKYLDTVTICPNQIAQHAALWGMQNLSQWLAGERAEILDRRDAIQQGFHRLKDWKLLGLGAYFAYVAHPFDIPSNQLAKKLVQKAGVLMLPGTMFRPADDRAGKQELRIAFANIDRDGVDTLFSRLENLTL